MKRIVLGFPAVNGQIAKDTADIVIAICYGCIMPSSFHHLLSLACPCALRLMRPPYLFESSPSCFFEVFARRVLHCIDVETLILSGAHQDCPTTVFCMCKMFLNRVIVWFPSIESS